MTQSWGNSRWSSPTWSSPTPQWGYYPPPDPRQRYRSSSKRGKGLRYLLLAVIGIVSVIGFVVTFWSYLSNELDQTIGTNPPVSSPVNPYPPDTTDPTPTSPDNFPKPDTDPPDIPEPETWTEAEEWLEDSELYSESIQVPTNCTIRAVDSQSVSPDELEEHLNELTGCLWLVWHTPVEQAGYEMPRPPVRVYSSEIMTACGKLDDVNAVYCAGDQHIYYAEQVYLLIPKKLRSALFVDDTIIAHEFAHAIQARTGILVASLAIEQRSSTPPEEALAMSRRTEMNADCMAGMFVGSVADANNLTSKNLQNLEALVYGLGDDVITGEPGYVDDHGSGAARRAWFVTGLGTDAIGKCNTYTVSSSKVR